MTVEHFEFIGNTLFTADQLAALIASYIGRPISLLEIYEAADKVAEFYIRNDYTLTSVTPPAQKISDGVVKLQVIEGRIARISLAGTSRYSSDQVMPYLGEFESGQIYRATPLSNGLQRVNRLPGLNTKAVLQPGDIFGTSDLLIQANEQPINASLAADNHGRRNIGEYRASLSGAFNNPFYLEDQLQLLYLHSEANRLNYGYLGYSLPIRHLGLRSLVGPRLSASYSQAEFTALTPPPSSVAVTGANKSGRLGLDWPLQVTREGQSGFGIAGTNQKSNSDISGIALQGSTNISLLELSANYAHVSPSQATTQWLATVSSNFKKATVSGCRPTPTDCHDQLFRLELDGQALLPIFGRLDGYAHVNGVYSPDVLPAATQYSIGGPSSVRGYASAEGRGDRGCFASLGLRQGFALGPAQLALRIFADSGQVSYVSPAPPETPGRVTLSSAGAGADLNWRVSGFDLNAKVDWSHPYGSYTPTDPQEDKSSRLFGSLSISY